MKETCRLLGKHTWDTKTIDSICTECGVLWLYTQGMALDSHRATPGAGVILRSIPRPVDNLVNSCDETLHPPEMKSYTKEGRGEMKHYTGPAPYIKEGLEEVEKRVEEGRGAVSPVEISVESLTCRLLDHEWDQKAPGRRFECILCGLVYNARSKQDQGLSK